MQLHRLRDRTGRDRPQGEGFQAGSPVTFTLHSDPIVLGSAIADQNGDVVATLLVPDDIPGGQHHIVVSGLSENGSPVENEIAVTVIAPAPLWVWIAGAGAVLALFGGVAVLIVGLIKRRTARGTIAATTVRDAKLQSGSGRGDDRFQDWAE
ncbi:hypothetical protein GCM10027411_26380 [Microbacterium aureliae]